ncbi:ATP-grasp domain-containing protein [Cytobacillus sp. Sa5YUA1]|uniref:ATP-grasp domain-containing protein n=1 Tax=Cytobacillus stercorigallinarum TaxID=2762240 RepID=A0ABR8QSW1_9BACI|nr:ATP-grasp domain-containing protein [Cytobacillus stercorigallinarum]MBD7938628.1 ATP-grasp domain-containing protein [Cytobacillus stercorigallinarum]
MDYKGKRLLILGGITHMIDVVQAAKKMGLYTIVTDFSPNSPAKFYADKSYDVSTTDIEMLVKIAKEEKIDGVFSAFEDLNLWSAQILCEKLNLPYYATKEQLKNTTDKKRFKDICRKYDVPVIEEYSFNDIYDESIYDNIEFPVIIKPVDSYGSRGITICHSKNDLIEGYEKAISFSKEKRVIIERFIDNDYGVEMYYTIQEGNITLSAMADRYVCKQSEELPPLPIATVLPSKHIKHYCNELDNKIRDMIRGLGIKNGVILIQSLVEEDSYFVYEMAFRLSGEKHYQIVEKQTGVSLLEMMISLAIGGDTDRYDLTKYDYAYTPYPSCNLSFLLKEGIIDNIIGLEVIENMPEVLSYVLTHEVGDKIEASGSYSQMFLRINIFANTVVELFEIIDTINKVIQVISNDGEDMILTRFDGSCSELERLR